MKKAVSILLIEDGETFAVLLKEWLRISVLYQFDHVHVDTLSAAKSVLSQRQFDLIVLDLMLPNGEGIRLVEQVGALACGKPIVVCTILEGEELEVEAIRKRASRFISKKGLDGQRFLHELRCALAAYEGQQACQPAQHAIKQVREVLVAAKEAIDIPK